MGQTWSGADRPVHVHRSSRVDGTDPVNRGETFNMHYSVTERATRLVRVMKNLEVHDKVRPGKPEENQNWSWKVKENQICALKELSCVIISWQTAS